MCGVKKIFIALLLIIIPINISSQEDNICDCCSYASLQYQQDYDEIFSPSLIKSFRFKEVKVYTESKSAMDSISSNKYREIKFKFNDDGLVVLKTHYNSMGKPHSTYELKRNRYGKVSQQIFNYIDSLEQKASFFSSEIIDYTYDTRRKLIKIKERDYKGNIIPDEKAKYTQLRYDSKDRIVKVVNHRNYNDESSISITEYKYSNDSLSSTFQTIRDGTLSASGEKKYNNNWKEVSSKLYNENLKNDAFQYYYEYDSEGRLIKFQSISGSGSFDECPEDNSFVDIYLYNDNGFLSSIEHEFAGNSCKMTFEYK
jgi:hypothetical protein